MVDVTIVVTADRVKQDAEGNWYVTVTPDDFDGKITPEQYDRWNAAPDTAVAEVEVKVVGRNPMPKGTDLRLIMPDNRQLGTLGRYVPDGAIMVKRPKEVVQVNPTTLKDISNRGRDPAPTLSDQLLFEKQAFPGAVPRKVQDAVKAAHRTSRAFVFDRAASYRLGEICARNPDLIADQQEFARPPFPRTWIEYESGPFLDALEAAGLEVSRSGSLPLDDKVGFLITERSIYVAASAPTKTGGKVQAGWSPWAYRLHQPMTHDQEQRFCRDFACSRIQIDQFFWGVVYDGLDASHRRAFRAQHGVECLFPEGVVSPGDMNRLLTVGAAGEFKTAIAAALLLIRPNMLVTKEERLPGRRLVSGRPTVFLAHRVVTIKLSHPRLLSRIKRACKEERGRARARWHEVRGHYMHNHRAKVADCVHDWREAEPLKWECGHGCGGRRAWRTYPDGRGTAEVGVVTKHYVVKP